MRQDGSKRARWPTSQHPPAGHSIAGWAVGHHVSDVLNAAFASARVSTLTDYAALLAVMLATGINLYPTVAAEGWLSEKITVVFSRITAIILTGLSLQ